MTTSHPTDRTLAALLDGRLDSAIAADIRRHIGECARCQLRLGAAGDRALTSERFNLPDRSTVTQVEESTTPERGDIWRLSWDTTILLAVIWQPSDERVWVLPVVGTADADEWCAVLGAEMTGHLGEMAVSVAMESSVPWSVLHAGIGQVTDMEGLESLRRAFRTGSATTTHRGEPVHSQADDHLVGLERVAEDLAELANAHWAPIPAAEATVTFDFEQLIEAGLDTNRALALTNRGGTPTKAEADLIEAKTGMRPPSAAPVDEVLRRRIDQPRRKSAIRRRAHQAGQDEAAFRLWLARNSQPELAAARGTTGGAAPDYDTILDRLLRDD